MQNRGCAHVRPATNIEWAWAGLAPGAGEGERAMRTARSPRDDDALMAEPADIYMLPCIDSRNHDGVSSSGPGGERDLVPEHWPPRTGPWPE